MVVVDESPFVVIEGDPFSVGGITITFENGIPIAVEGNPVIIEITPIAPVGTQIAGGATGQPVEISAVQMTATALSNVLITPTMDMSSDITPIDGGGVATAAPVATQDFGSGGGELPDTGLFDDVFGGNPMAIFFAAFGLLGVIVVSRQLRRKNRKRK